MSLFLKLLPSSLLLITLSGCNFTDTFDNNQTGSFSSSSSISESTQFSSSSLFSISSSSQNSSLFFNASSSIQLEDTPNVSSSTNSQIELTESSSLSSSISSFSSSISNEAISFSSIKIDILPAGEERTIQIDAHNSSAVYSLKNAPTWMSINKESGLLTCKAPKDSTEAYAFEVVASASGNITTSETIRGEVKSINLNLEDKFDNSIEKLAFDTKAGVEDVRSSGLYKVPNDMNDKNSTWDVIKVYLKDYKTGIEFVIIDGDSGEIKKVDADGAAFNGMHNVISPEGKLYMISGKADGTIKPQINIYDPKTNTLSLDAIELPDNIYGDTYNGIQISTDSKMFIYARHKSDDEDKYKPRIFEIDYKTNTVISDSGPILQAAEVWKITADDNYIYLLTGKVPWGVIQYERAAPHSAKVIASGDRVNVMQSAYGVVLEEGDKKYFLYEDKKYPADDAKDWRRTKTPWPFPDGYSDFDEWYTLVIRTNIVDRFLPNKPEIITDNSEQLNGEAELWIRQPKENELKKYAYTLKTYPTTIGRVLTLSNGKIFASSGPYDAYVTYDPNSDTFERSLGSLPVSMYTMLESDNKIYISGYPRGMLLEYDYNKPWTQGVHNFTPGKESVDYRDQSLNPRWCGKLAEYGSGAHKMYASAKGANGLLYFGGQWMRDGNGGGLAWYNPKTKKMGGISAPFLNYAIQHLTPVNEGKYIAIATVPVTSPNGFKPKTGKLFLFNTQTQILEKTLDPMKGMKGSITGQIIGVDKDYIVGFTKDPESYSNTYIYRINIKTGKLDYLKKYLRKGFESNFAIGKSIMLNSEGKIISWLGWDMIELDPISGDITPIAQYNHGTRKGIAGDATLLGDDVYIGRFSTILKLEK